uniref:Protein GUCD1 n=1 Tax=Rhizophora mucronata TaxID=61149 RepID=A0A2P2JJY5_RHIMU
MFTLSSLYLLFTFRCLFFERGVKWEDFKALVEILVFAYQLICPLISKWLGMASLGPSH